MLARQFLALDDRVEHRDAEHLDTPPLEQRGYLERDLSAERPAAEVALRAVEVRHDLVRVTPAECIEIGIRLGDAGALRRLDTENRRHVVERSDDAGIAEHLTPCRVKQE